MGTERWCVVVLDLSDQASRSDAKLPDLLLFSSTCYKLYKTIILIRYYLLNADIIVIHWP